MADTTYTFDTSLTGSAGSYVLLATADFQTTYSITADFTIPDGFLAENGSVNYAGGASTLQVGSFPTASGTPRNNTGTSITVSSDVTDPVISNVPTSPLQIVSNSAIPVSNQQVVDFLAPISCTDETTASPNLVVTTPTSPAEFPAGETTSIPISCTDDAGNKSNSQTQVTIATFTDSDSDGVGDDSDTDDDDDGVLDTSDAFPLDNTESIDTDGDGIGNNADLDDDGDNSADNLDDFPLDNTETTDTDNDRTGDNADTDDDGDGVDDADDEFPLDKAESTDTDTDGIGNNADTDDDGDGVSDSTDAFPLDSNETIDTDEDGTGDNADSDDDDDGVAD